MKVEPFPTLNQQKKLEAIQMLTDPKMQPLFQKISSEYLYWDKVKYIVPNGVDIQILWHAVKIQRLLNAQIIKFGKYEFHFTITKNMLALLHDFDMNLGGSLGTKSIIPTTDKNYYLISSIMEEAIASSQMEGASTTRRIAKDMLRKQLKPKNKSQQMIVNNYETINRISKGFRNDFSLEGLLDIHRSISNKTLDNPEDEGILRKNDDILVVDGITGSIAHIPPSCTEINEMINDLCKFANNDTNNNFIHPIIKGIIIHFMLAYIHPFVDGNGRTARALFYWYMLKQKYWLTEYLSISRVIAKSKTAYEKSFRYAEADRNDIGYFVAYNLRVLGLSFNQLQDYLKRKQEEKKAANTFLQLGNINNRQAQIIKMFVDNPKEVITVKDIQSKFFISATTAKVDIMGLVNLGLLDEFAFNKVKRGYVRSKNFVEAVKPFLK